MHELFALAENIVLAYVLLHKYPSERKLLWLVRKNHSIMAMEKYNIIY